MHVATVNSSINCEQLVATKERVLQGLLSFVDDLQCISIATRFFPLLANMPLASHTLCHLDFLCVECRFLLQHTALFEEDGVF